jgi:hypothetical protein
MTLVVFFFTLSLFYENFITSSLIAPPLEIPFHNITEAIKAGYILKEDYEIIRFKSNGLKHPKSHGFAWFGSDADLTGPEMYITNIGEFLFPDKKKYIYPYRTVHHSSTMFRLISEIKHPYKCMQTKDGIGISSWSLVCQGGMKSQLAPIFEWILEASLHMPYSVTLNDLLEFVRRNIQYKLSSYKRRRKRNSI